MKATSVIQTKVYLLNASKFWQNNWRHSKYESDNKYFLPQISRIQTLASSTYVRACSLIKNQRINEHLVDIIENKKVEGV